MRVGELARRTGVTIRALRYYERLGLVVPSRLPNGYRDYDAQAVRQVQEIRELTDLGLAVEETRPFVECLASGHDEGDECPASMAAYKHAIDKLTELKEALHLPAFTTAGMTLYKRLTMVVTDGVIEHVFYPVFPPDRHAEEVLEWLS